MELFDGRFLAASSAAAQAAAGSPFWNLRPGEIGPGIAEVRGILDRLVQHRLRIARPLGDQKQAAIVGLERLHRIRLLERDLEQFVGRIEIVEARLGNHREAVIDGALFG